MEPHQRIEELGWLQGKFLPRELVAAVRPIPGPVPAPSENDALMVVSQSCDLVHRNFQNEPSCEALLFRPVAKRNRQRSYGESPRFLQIELRRRGTLGAYEAAAYGRLILDRQRLTEHPPSEEWACNPDDVDLVTRWLAKRYERPALPTAFNDRLYKQAEAIDKILKEKHTVLTDILLQLDSWDELPQDKPYRVRLLLVASESVLTDEALRAKASKLRDELGNAFKACPGINLVEIELLADTTTSWALVRSYTEWDFDYLTIRDDAAGD